MKNSLLLLLLSLFCFESLQAQMPLLFPDGSVVINKANTKFTFIPYTRNVVKVIVQPAGYTKNELVSDAVIAKPVKTAVKVKSAPDADYTIAWDAMQIAVKSDTIFFGGKRNALLTNLVSNGDYRGFKFVLTEDEKIFGAGERALPQNRRGYKQNLYNNPAYGYGMGAENLNYSVPFITSSNNYAIFFDNPSKGYIDIGKTSSNLLEYGAVSGELNFYLITGTSYPDILASYHSLTGTQPVPPRWAFGNFMSRFGYMSENEVKGIARKMHAANIPFDAVIFDLFWFGDSIKGTLGNLDWVNKKAWPNPEKMIVDFEKEGEKTILITEPFVLNSSANYNAAKKFLAVDISGKPYALQDFYFGKGGLIDIFRKDSRNWFWSKYKAQMLKGVEGWWGDLGEPEKHPANLYHNLKDLGFKRLFKADEVHNMYGHYWTKMLYEKYETDYPDKRLFSLNRSGFAGTQRYSIFPWTGDVGRNWSGLQAQLPVLLGMSMSGVPYVHSDAGGFAGGEKDAELYVRWLQFAQFTPIFKPHGTELTLIDTTVSNFPSEPALFNEPYLSLARKVVNDRYKMLPYNYSLAYQQATAGKPLISPLYYYFAKDMNSYKTEDEFMWGENILVAPVLQKGATARTVYLPEGTWYNYKTNTAIKGGQSLTDTVTLDAIPVYIKAGSFIATNNISVKNTTQYNTSDITVTYFPSQDFSNYTLFDDDGNTNKSLQKKEYELITFETDGLSAKSTFNIKSNKGTFPGKPAVRQFTFTIPGLQNMPAEININGKPVAQKRSTDTFSQWNEQTKTIHIHFSFTGDPVVISLQK